MNSPEDKVEGTGVYCVCTSEICALTSVPYVPRSDPRAFGPGSENIATEVDRYIIEFYCGLCGLTYKDVGQFSQFKAQLKKRAMQVRDARLSTTLFTQQK